MPAASTVAEMQVVVSADTTQAEKGLGELGKSIGSTGNAMSLAFGTAAVAGIAAVGAGLAGAVSAAADFEKTLSSVKAVSGATAEEMSQLSALALQLGKDTSFSASEAGKGIEELVKGGLSIPDIMNGAAEATLNLAAAGGVSLPDAATIAANALAQFNLKGEDMAHVADLIAGAANASALDVSDFKFSLTAAGAVASTVGFSFDDLAQAIAIMGKAGITGSDAGTSLKTMFMNLSPQTKKASDEMRELGIITADGTNRFFDAEGKVKSFAEVSQILQEATANLTNEQKLGALQTMFGSDAIRAAAVAAKEGAAGVNEMAESMGKVTAAAVGAEKLNNLTGSFEQMKGSVETLLITFGRGLLPALKDVVDGTTAVINVMIPLAEKWGPAVGAAMATLVGDLRTLFGGFVSWFVENWPLIQKTYDTVTGGLETDNGRITTSFTTTWDGIKTLTGDRMTEIGDAIKLAMQLINRDWEGAWKTLGTISDTEQKIANQKTQENAAIGQGIIDLFTHGMLTRFETDMKSLNETIIGPGWQAINDTTKAAFNASYGIVGTVAVGWVAVVNKTQTLLGSGADALGGVVTSSWQAVVDYLKSLARSGSDIVTAAASIGTAMLDGLKAGINDALGSLKSWIETNLTSALPEWVRSALGIKSPSTVFSDIGGQIVAGLIAGLGGRKDELLKTAGDMAAKLVNRFEDVGGAGGEVREYIIKAASGLGIDPRAALAIARHEGGEDDYMRVGKFKTGWSFWPFQLHYGGKGYESFGTTAGMGNDFTRLTGWQPGDVDAWKDSIDFALKHAAKYGWGAWYGRGPAGIGEWEGIPGKATGGWAGLHGPELAWLGERGPEYVVPNHALQSSPSSHSSITLNLAIGGRVAEQIVVEGYDLAVRRGRLPVRGLRLAGSAS